MSHLIFNQTDNPLFKSLPYGAILKIAYVKSENGDFFLARLTRYEARNANALLAITDVLSQYYGK